jgi:hypothetical protein
MTTQPDTTQHEDEFAAFLIQHSRGEAHDQISGELRELLAAVQEHGRKGSLIVNDPRQLASFDVRDLPTTRTEIKDI